MAEIRQRIVSCPHGHCYDANRYSTCPICESVGSSPMQNAVSSRGGAGAFPATQDPNSGGSGGGSRFPATQDPYSGGSGGGNRFPATQDPYSGANKASGVTMAPPYHGNSGFNGKMSQTCYVDPSTPAGAPVPVVGWLVAVSGPCRGTDYRIHNGYNYIGREEGDICVHGDYSISAVKDSNITYVPQTRSFYIAHELGKNVLLVNDVPVIGGAQKLNKNDIVTIGKTKLMFIPMCDEQFSWEDEV